MISAMRRWLVILLLILAAVLLCGACGFMRYRPPAWNVQATIETEPVPNDGDAADDLCLWIHPEDPELSTVIGTDKKGGLAVYDLTGRQLQYVPDGRPNNVDLRPGFPWQGEEVALVVASQKEGDHLVFSRVIPETRLLEPIPGGRIPVGVNPGGVTLYVSAISGRWFVFTVGEDSDRGDENWVEQWEVQGGDALECRRLRRLRIGPGSAEGLVADDELGWLYVSEENRGIWRYSAEPDASDERTLVDHNRFFGHLNNDVEGLAIYRTGERTGYLIASSQGSDDFTVYRREGDNDYLTRFEIVGGDRTDAVTHTDGIEASSIPLGASFPNGLFMAQDDMDESGRQNYKLVPWERIARRL